jgi:hypothetical protein
VVPVSFPFWTDPDKRGIPPAPGITLTLTARRSVSVTALFDTGASATNLDTSFRKALGIKLTQCVREETELTVGIKVPGFFTMVDATLDGHTFRMPVLFVPRSTPVLGRTGILDQFMIQCDPRSHQTLFTWVGPNEWAKNFEDEWKQKLKGQRGKHPLVSSIAPRTA